MATNVIEVDAIPLTFNEVTNLPEHILDPILNKLSVNDYRSIFFLLIDVKINHEDFLFLVQKDRDFLKNKFLNTYYEFRFKEALLIEIFGTMQKYDLLKLLETCSHVFKMDKDTFTQLKSLWKFLYCICEQLEDGDVDYLKEKLFHESENFNVCCAEELMCLAFSKGKLEENNWKDRLSDIFKCFHPICSKLIISYKDSNLKYYPVRRPSKRAHCGIAVIMNHVKFDVDVYKDRPESNSDANALKKLWESFGFKTEIFTDKTAEEVIQIFQNLSKEKHSNYDVFIACYLSHGDEGIVIAKDGKPIKLTDLVDLIANQCETLVGKPKLFFVQACQGRRIQTGFGGPIYIPNFNTQVESTRHSRNVALRSDCLIFNSSIEGFVSFRGSNNSWFIQELVSSMEKFGEKLTVGNVLTEVQRSVIEKTGEMKDIGIICKQTPVLYSTLKYELKLKKVL